MKTRYFSLYAVIMILSLSCGERRETKQMTSAEKPAQTEEPPQQAPQQQNILTAEEQANEFLKGTWIGSDNLDYYVFTGSELIKQTEEGQIVIRAGYKVFFADETEFRLKFKDGSKGSILRMGDELLFGKETLKKKSNSTTPIKAGY